MFGIDWVSTVLVPPAQTGWQRQIDFCLLAQLLVESVSITNSYSLATLLSEAMYAGTSRETKYHTLLATTHGKSGS